MQMVLEELLQLITTSKGQYCYTLFFIYAHIEPQLIITKYMFLSGYVQWDAGCQRVWARYSRQQPGCIG